MTKPILPQIILLLALILVAVDNLVLQRQLVAMQKIINQMIDIQTALAKGEKSLADTSMSHSRSINRIGEAIDSLAEAQTNTTQTLRIMIARRTP